MPIMLSHAYRVAAILASVLSVLVPVTLTQGQELETMEPDYGRLLQALKPTMTIEVAEQNINEYLATRPPELKVPEGFEDPRVALTQGTLEISARKDLLFLSTRVRVGLTPQVVDGRLRLKVRRVHAGPVPLPSNFHAGVGDAIEQAVNAFLDHNELQLLSVEALPKTLRVTARAMPLPAPDPLAP